MKKTYKTPTLLVVKIQPATFIATSENVKMGEDYNGSFKLSARGSRFSDDDWDEE